MGSISRIVLALSVLVVSPAAAANEISVKPGDDVAEIVEQAPSGATFRFAPGVYRMQHARPKNGQKFIGQEVSGQAEVIFNGATVLTDWRKSGALWIARGPEKRLEPSGKCYPTTPLCGHREDLFVDGKVFRRVASLGEVRRGTHYDDGLNIHIADDPSGKLTEFGVLPFAFSSAAEGVVVQDIVVEKYASAAQRGALEFAGGRNWELRNVTARLNHGVGARIGSGTRVSGGSFSQNGQLGLGGGNGKDIIVENVQIAFNNYAGYRAGWEAGGLKIVRVDGLVIRKSCVYRNEGPGLWTDQDNINVEIADNLVFDNIGDGIKHEISYRATIRDNVVARNGFKQANWLWGSQILIQNSQDVEVRNNMVELRPDYGNGISVINQDRGEGRLGPRVAKNNSIHDNTIVHFGAHGSSGMVADYAADWFFGNSANAFDRNIYVVPHVKRGYFAFRGNRVGFPTLQNFGLEKNGRIEIATADRKPLKFDCAAVR